MHFSLTIRQKLYIMKLIYISFSVLCLLIFTTSCSYFKRSDDTKVIYTVKFDKLDVRQKPDGISNIIGTVYMGDTIIPTTDWNFSYVAFNYKGTTGCVPEGFLNSHRVHDMGKVSNMQLGGTATIIRDYLNYYVNWRKGRFWLIFLVLIVASIIFIKLGKILEDNMYNNYGFNGSNNKIIRSFINIIGAFFSIVESIIFRILGVRIDDYMYDFYDSDEVNYNKLPYFSAIIGVLFSMAYMFFREDVLQAMFVTKFYWISFTDSWLYWYLWLVSLIGVVGLFYFWIKDFVNYGYRGIRTVLYFTFLAIITFNVGLFGGIITILFTGLWITISIWIAVNSGSGSYVGSSKQSSKRSSNKLSSSERVRRFHMQKEIDRQFKKDLENWG